MNQISDRIQALAPSATLAMSQKSAELRAQGIDVINLSVGEPDFYTPDHIKQAIVDKLQRENGLTFTPDQIVVGNGAKHELCNAVMALVNPGDEVVIPTPAWVSYVQMVNLAGGKSVLVPATIEQDFKVTPAQLEAAITPRTRLVIICSPSNPSGAVYSRDELSGLAQVLARHPQVMIVADEIYEHINYVGRHESIAQFESVRDRVVIVNGVSKAYAMTGWRIGYIAAPLWLAKAVTKLQGQYTSGVSSIAQKAAEAAYRGPQECVELMRQAFERRRDLIVGLLKEIPGMQLNVPQGAFYVFPRVTAFLGKRAGDKLMETDTDLALYLLTEGHVATVAGSAFSCPGYLRLSYATSDENLVEAARRIAEALGKLQ